MRVTLQTRIATRERILEVAAKLFAKNGWDNATTRSIAAAADIATGTLFNYFASKEAIAAALVSQGLAEAKEEFASRRRGEESLEEELFSFVCSGLRRLRPARNFLGAAMETLLSPLARLSQEHAGDSIRTDHLETVEQLIVGHGVAGPVSAMTLQLYWTLYLGVLAFWSADASPKQEDTLALLDESLKLFVASLRRKAFAGGKVQGANGVEAKEMTDGPEGE
jgi:AcrR family transcriptional regulator